MAKTKISEFSATPGNNTDIDGINIAEGCAPSGINDAIRELMSQLKDFQTGAAGDSFNGPVGSTTPAAGAFTTLTSNGNTTLGDAVGDAITINGTATYANANPTYSAGTANGVGYLNGSKQFTTGSALTFDGTNLGLGVTPSASWFTGSRVMQVGATAALWNNGANNSSFSHNAIFGNSTTTYQATGFASYYRQLDGQHNWFTAPSGTAGDPITFTQAMTLDASGNLGIGVTSPASILNIRASSATITVDDSGDGTSKISFRPSAASYAERASLSVNYGTGELRIAAGASGGGFFQSFYTNNTERARIDSSGNLLVGTTSATGLGVGTAPIQSDGTIFAGGTNAGFAFKDRGASTFSLWYKTSGVNYFYTSGAGANVASINETTGAYTALSDVAKKKDFEESMIGLDAVMHLQPKLFRMLSDDDAAPKQLGFIAQDVQAVIPQAYVEQNGENGVFIGLQDRPFIAALVKAIQEQQAIIEQLIARVAQLEGK